MKRFTLLFLVAAACGGSDKPAPTTPTGSGGEDHGKEHVELTPELEAFHDTLSPLWHADAGDARRKDTCAAVPDLQAKAGVVKAAAPPAGVDAAAWTEAGAHLDASVGGLATACAGTEPAPFDTAFEEVHNAFHHAMELQMGKGGEHGEHEGMEGMDHGEHGEHAH